MINQLFLSPEKQLTPTSPRNKRNIVEHNNYASPTTNQKKNNSSQPNNVHLHTHLNYQPIPTDLNEK